MARLNFEIDSHADEEDESHATRKVLTERRSKVKWTIHINLAHRPLQFNYKDMALACFPRIAISRGSVFVHQISLYNTDVPINFIHNSCSNPHFIFSFKFNTIATTSCVLSTFRVTPLKKKILFSHTIFFQDASKKKLSVCLKLRKKNQNTLEK